MTNADEGKPISVFATIHFKSENRPDGYTPEEIYRINHELNQVTDDTMTRTPLLEKPPAHHCEWCGNSKSLWEYIDREESYDWAVSQVAQDELARLFGHGVEAIFQGDPAEQNRNLREAIAGRMGQDNPRQNELWEWVIVRWGRIFGGGQAVPFWIIDLNDLGPDAVNDFIANMGTERIASWSKVLAFHDYKQYAIYDARTALTLNCALDAIEDQRRFFMPPSRIDGYNKVGRKVANPVELRRRGYSAYLALLRCLVYHECATDILGAEMIIFANAEVIAAAFGDD